MSKNEKFNIKISDNNNNQFYGSNIYLDNSSFFVLGNTDSSVFISKIKEQINDGVSSQTNIKLNYSLSENFPNPFNSKTTINYSIPHRTHLRIEVFDILKRVVIVLVDNELNLVNYKIDFDASNLPSGLYFYRMLTNDYTKIKKAVLLK